ncbi:uncharacterized protein LOC121735687, partial [Aricia agestis]|uniref:uncharacterized protein LOC121735687 n=1 Tax=Aricia agestis TaxID=91739 RepID=UPI001C202414
VSVLGDREPPDPTPLPRPRWAPPRAPLRLTAAAHCDLAAAAEAALRALLGAHNYDSVANFVALHDEWERRGEALAPWFREYAPPVRSGRSTCVGLAIELVRTWRELERQFPGFASATGLASCEEAVAAVGDYVTQGESPEAVDNAEKEHVMVAVRVVVDGRAGVLLADPGYHVPRVITVMADRQYPHTGWFTQSDEPHCRKEYSYSFSPLNPGYVEWHERETRGAVVKTQTSLVYVARPYIDAVNVTERRNLVYNFRSLLSRDQKGHLVAGLYFPVTSRKDASFTLFYDAGGEKPKTKYKFSAFHDPKNIPPSLLEEVEICNSQMNYKEGELLNIIFKLSKVMSSQPFIDQVLEINDDICRMCL